MHARPPPEKVILVEKSDNKEEQSYYLRLTNWNISREYVRP